MSEFERSRSVVSIPPGASFLPTLVDALIHGRLIDGFHPGHDPLALADATIWVPTRRAARALATEFVSRLDGQAALLPSIRALGDVDEDGYFFERDGDGANYSALLAQEPIGSLERQTVLAQMISAWSDSLNDAQREIYSGQEILMPASFADAAWFAQDLARLMDMVSTEEVDWEALDDLVPDERGYADWWKLTLEFLKIATKAWPSYLNERGAVDGASLRATWLRAQAEIYRSKGSRGPVIAAGSTGSIPATADLLDTIAHMPNGVVILPGLDRTMHDEDWAKVDLPDNDRDDGGTAPGHPQYGLKRLIDRLGKTRADVVYLGGADDTGIGYARVREEIVSAALLPSTATGKWSVLHETFSDEQRERAFEGIALVEAPGEREEALAIALALREKVENPAHTAALVTPDRNLARRVAVELRRFGLDVDDSAGQPLRNRAHGAFARLVLQVAFTPADPSALVSLIKHPLALFGAETARARNAARMLELSVLRGAVQPPVPGTLAARLAKIKNLHENKNKGDDEERAPWPVSRFTDEDWDDAGWLAEQIDTIFAPLTTTTFAEHTRRTIALIEACGADEEQSLKHLYKDEEGTALCAFLTDLADQMDATELDPVEWPDVFDAFLASRVVRPNGGTHPRVSILGPLEARLQTYDRVVLGGLNEGSWPASARNDPFLSRPMKAELGLPPPERRTGLAAHDFQMLLGMEDVVLTRSIRTDNAPTIASRWLQRLLIVGGNSVERAVVQAGRSFLDWTMQIDEPAGPPVPAPRPAPVPPLAKRPKRMSVTEVETWVNDPYAIYAKKILHLQALDPLSRDADAREKGTLYHSIFEDFIREYPRIEDPLKAQQALREIADRRFSSSIVPLEIAALWRPRFDVIGEQFIDWHNSYRADVKKFHIELHAQLEIDGYGFTLSGRADRIDVKLDGTLAIFDYKTSGNPSAENARKLYSPQLPLEAAMVARGAFKAVGARQTSSLGYIRLRPAKELKIDLLEGKDETSHELGERAWEQLLALITAYADPAKPYVSKARIHKGRQFESSYDHVARVREWAYSSDEDGA
ncbi:double-strand break repair protein AddB [Pseudahrensia aquimaris]|uniref:Double-strand break repair protein AddB n=1 Tax=Pseudahrensia aquimaris TaxID=744461 RepID=A0ABW3FEK7_9HYPH